ncbi:suppressor protein SRP40 isoform X2 [Hippocampus comes]|uniref:suppressor protein SRP40 isoform X2 n=1 Tax=Hippocampus comes TaxID=109280 RepID=UPI00094E445F|nr:PREDICTED: NADH dehydrogenase [ubiquinone] flavoprotein 3, mitochondrial isoform X2 [Hippocampus comes]
MWKMSTSILPLRRLWALKHYQVENWGILRTGVSALCTTQKDEAIKSTEKTNDTDERAALLTHKTPVSFPTRVSNNGAFPTQPLGIAISVSAGKVVDALPVIDTRSPVADDAFTPAPAPGHAATTKTLFSEHGDQSRAKITSSSSSDSSDSDSESDSESEDDNLETSTSVQEVPELRQIRQIKSQHITSKENGDSNKPNKEVLAEHEAKNDSPTLPAEAAHASAPLPAKAAHIEASKNTKKGQNFHTVEDLIDSAPRLQDVPEELSDTTETGLQSEAGSSSELIARVISPTLPVRVEDSAGKAAIEVSSPGQDPSDGLVEITEPVRPEVSANTAHLHVEDESDLQGTVAPPCGTAAVQVGDALPSGAATDVATTVPTSSPHPSELLHPLGELQTQTPHEGSATMVPAEPEDTFDNTLYRNYEHHSYSTYTFADMDVEMAKYRLPQPTSGRPSPRH